MTQVINNYFLFSFIRGILIDVIRLSWCFEYTVHGFRYHGLIKLLVDFIIEFELMGYLECIGSGSGSGLCFVNFGMVLVGFDFRVSFTVNY